MPLIVLTPFTSTEQAQTYFNYASGLSPIAYWRLGDVALANIDDTFTGTDGDVPNVDLWIVSSSEVSIQNNKLNYTDATTGNISNYFVFGTHEFVGDFDFQVDFDFVNLTQSTTNDKNGILFGINKTHVIRKWNSIDGNVYQFLLYNEADSLLGNFSVATTDTVGKLRFTRVGNIYTAYYWSGSQWEWNGDINGISYTYAYNFTLVHSKPRILFQKGDVALTVNADNFTVNSGTYAPVIATDTIGNFDGDYLNFPTTNTPSLLLSETDNKAVSFDGISQGVQLPVGMAKFTGDFTIVFLVSTIDDVTGRIFYNYDEIDNSGYTVSTSPTTSQMRFTSYGLATNIDFTSTTDLSGGGTYHVVVKREGTSAYIFINGVYENSAPVSSTAFTGTTTNAYIGHDSVPDNFFDGIVDEVSLYDYALTPTEISTLYSLTGLA